MINILKNLKYVTPYAILFITFEQPCVRKLRCRFPSLRNFCCIYALHELTSLPSVLWLLIFVFNPDICFLLMAASKPFLSQHLTPKLLQYFLRITQIGKWQRLAPPPHSPNFVLLSGPLIHPFLGYIFIPTFCPLFFAKLHSNCHSFLIW